MIRKAKPDLLGRKLERAYRKGFFRWSARGGSHKLLARTEVEPTQGGRFGFNCAGCCLEFPYGAIDPGSATFLAGSSASFVAGEYRNTCSGGLLGPFSASSPTLTVPSPFSWNGFTVRASSPGSGTLSFTATATRYEVISGICMTFTDTVAGSGSSNAIQVRITSADVTKDRIGVKLSPSGLSGTLTLKLTTPNNHTIRQVTRSSGTHTETFNITGLPTGEFRRVEATWGPINGVTASATRNYRIRVLGNYRHTRYNTPIEARCSGSSTSNFQYNEGKNGTCGGIPCSTVGWTLATAKPVWVREVGENGSGVHRGAGLLSQEWSCTEPSPQTGVRMRKVSAPCASCGGSLTKNKSVATRSGHPYLKCGNRVYVHGVGVVTVKDTGALAEAQLDHYYGKTACNDAPTIGTKKTIKLY